VLTQRRARDDAYPLQLAQLLSHYLSTRFRQGSQQFAETLKETGEVLTVSSAAVLAAMKSIHVS
jgi:hypothetical protein